MAGIDTKNSFALIVGVGARAGQNDANMHISANDADYIDHVVKTFLSLPPENVTKKTNQDAGTEAVLKALDDLIGETKERPADLVIIYFSGHGCQIRDTYYLVCNDTENNNVSGKAIEGSVFVAKLNEINAAKMIILLDCCHAQGMTETPAAIPFDKNTLISRHNRVVITACGREQVSYLSEPVSLFTYALIEGLLGHCFTSGDTDIKIFQLALYIRERTSTLSEQLLKPYEPQKMQLEVLPDSRTSNFIIVTYPNGQSKKMPQGLEKLYKLGAGKEVINTEMVNTADTAFRREFNWLSNNNIDIDGNNNITVIGSTNVTINANIGYDDLKEMFKSQSEILRQIQQKLAGSDEPKLKLVYDKIEISEIEYLLEEGTIHGLGEAISSFIGKARTFPEKNIYTALVTLKGDFQTLLEDEQNGLDIEQKRKRAQIRLAKIVDSHKSNLVD
jgi:hypothetical protein